MVAPADKRLLWHPLRKNRFVVGGTTQITLYEWRPEAPEIKQISSQHDLQLMKCFAWSPDPSFDDLIAVGMSTGRVDLMRLEASKYARDTVLSSGPSVSLPVRSSRSCNALAFCPLDPNYLAVGLDKVRGDSSLVIWDISTATPTLSLRESASLPVISATPSSRPQPLIPRAELGPKTDSRILQQHAPAEIVSSLSYVTQSTCLLWAGMSNRWLRLFDLRTPGPVPSITNAASKVQAIATDPFDSHRIGTFGDGIVSIWDSRRLPHPLVTFTENDASADGSKFRPNHSTFNTLEFSSVRRGVLATLEKDSTHVRFWDLQEAQTSEIFRERSRDSSHSISGRAGGGKLSWANPSSMLSWTASSSSNASSADGIENAVSTPASNIILSDTRKTKEFPSPLASFALVPSTRVQPLSSNVIIVNKEGDLEVYAVHDIPNYGRWSNQGDFIMAVGTSYRAFSGFSRMEQGPNPWDVSTLSHSAGETPAGDTDPINTEELAPPMLARGRSQSMVSPPTFGRGDQDGFPALNAPVVDGGHSGGKSRDGSLTRTLSSFMVHDYFKNPPIHPPVVESPREPEAGSSSRADKLALQRHIRYPHHRHSTRNKQISASDKLRQVIQSDISVLMRCRAVKGYGVANLAHNSVVVDDDPVLSELWSWIDHSRRLLQTPKPRPHDFDFACQGLLGIWEGFPPSTGRIPNDTAPPPSPAAGFKPLVLERSASSSDLVQQFSTQGRTHTKLTSSKRRTHFFVDSTGVIAGASGVLDTNQDIFSLAVSTLSTKDGDKGRVPGSWKPGTPTAKLVQRRFGLQLCGWNLREEELNNAIRIWESENKQSQAACWLVFTGQYHKAVDVLMRSKDETHYLISGTLAALCSQATADSGAKINPDLRQHCERLIVKLQDPYLRAMLTHLTANDWSEVIDEESIPLRERLAIALQFLDDKSLSSYLRRIAEEASHRGDISGLIVTGLTTSGIDILQSYVDVTGDVQTAAILSCYRTASALAGKVGSRDTRDSRKFFIDRWVETYQDLLDGWKMFYHRCQFDIDRGQLLQEAIREGDIQPFGEWVTRQVVIRCNYCNKTIDVVNLKSRGPNACPNCGRGLPRCSICLMTLTVVPDASRDAKLVHTNSEDTINEAIVFCQTCRHGGHASHIMEWFFGEIENGGELANGGRVHNVCPVADCDCHCANEL